MMPEGGNRLEDEVPVVNWKKVFLAIVAVLLITAGYVAIDATRKVGQIDKGGPQATAQQFVETHLRVERQELGILHFHDAQETQVEKLNDRQLRVTGIVDVIQPDGTARERRYSCTLTRLPNGEWAAENVFVLPTS